MRLYFSELPSHKSQQRPGWDCSKNVDQVCPPWAWRARRWRLRCPALTGTSSSSTSRRTGWTSRWSWRRTGGTRSWPGSSRVPTPPSTPSGWPPTFLTFPRRRAALRGKLKTNVSGHKIVFCLQELQWLVLPGRGPLSALPSLQDTNPSSTPPIVDKRQTNKTWGNRYFPTTGLIFQRNNTE